MRVLAPSRCSATSRVSLLQAALASHCTACSLAVQGMGRASVECISGCTCEPSTLDGWWERHASLQVMHTIRVSELGGLGGACSTGIGLMLL